MKILSLILLGLLVYYITGLLTLFVRSLVDDIVFEGGEFVGVVDIGSIAG